MVKQNLEAVWAVYAWEKANKCFLRSKSEWWLHKVIGGFWPAWVMNWWTTLRKPGEVWPTIWYPSHLSPGEAVSQISILNHELYHVDQQRTVKGWILTLLLTTLFPLPLFFSGRWFIERCAFLNDIARNRYSVDEAVDRLWYGYGFCWPRTLMRIWFLQRLADQDTQPIDTTELR